MRERVFLKSPVRENRTPGSVRGRLGNWPSYRDGGDLADNQEEEIEKVFVNVGLSLDGYLAPEGMTLENWDNPGYKNWAAKWGAMMGWVFNQQYFRENLKLGSGGETGLVNEMLKQTTERIGANIMGKRMFEGGERGWPEEGPVHKPVYGLTHD